MIEENIKGVSRKPRSPQSHSAWNGLTVADAIFSVAPRIDHDTASALETATLLAKAQPTEAWAVHFSGNWNSPGATGAGYLSISGLDGAIRLVEWSALAQEARIAILRAVGDRPVFTFDGSSVVGAFLGTGLEPPQRLVCSKTMARLLENRAYPDPKQKPAITYEPYDLLTRYGIPVGLAGANPVRLLPRLAPKLMSEIIQADLHRVLSLEHRLMPVTIKMQRAGLGIDRQRMEAVMKAASESATRAAEKVRGMLGRAQLNLHNPDELLEALKGAGIEAESTKREELALIEHPVAQAVVRFKDACSVRNDVAKCLDGLGTDGRIRPEWDALGAGTGRMSCSNPNLQSLKWDAEFRGCFIPARGYVYVSCDYAQADLRAIAFKAQDPALIDALAPDRDFHALTAGKILGKNPELISNHERDLSKTLTYGITYFMSLASLAKEAKFKLGQEWTKVDARQFVERLFSAYPGWKAYHDQVLEEAETATECRTLLYRRRRLLPQGPEFKMYRFRRMLNMAAQGTVGDALKEAMIAIAARVGATCFIILNVHDELVLEVPEESTAEVLEIARHEMAKAFSQAIPGIPIKVEVHVTRSLAY